MRLNGKDGSPDPVFGSTGAKVVALGSGNVDLVNALAIQGGGFVIAGGTVNGGANTDSFVARIGDDTLLDPRFAGGFVPHEFSDSVDAIDQLQGIAVDTSGRIVATGFYVSGPSNLEKVIVARFWP